MNDKKFRTEDHKSLSFIEPRKKKLLLNELSFDSIGALNNRKNSFHFFFAFISLQKIEKTRHGQIATIIVFHRAINVIDS